MSKQELIEKWHERRANANPYCVNRIPKIETLKKDLCGEFIDDLKQLDEPQKPVVPKCAELWLEGHCSASDVINLFIAVTYATDSDGFVSEKWKWSGEFYDWLVEDADTLYILCDALRYGYEVEKEPLYYVDFINNGDVHKRLVLDHENDKYNIVDWSDNLIGLVQEMFTEKEIKAIDVRYWAFAVKVEEVEG